MVGPVEVVFFSGLVLEVVFLIVFVQKDDFIKVNDVDGFVVCLILIYSHNGQPIYIGQVTLIRV